MYHTLNPTINSRKALTSEECEMLLNECKVFSYQPVDVAGNFVNNRPKCATVHIFNADGEVRIMGMGKTGKTFWVSRAEDLVALLKHSGTKFEVTCGAMIEINKMAPKLGELLAQ